MSKPFETELRRSLITLGWALLRYEKNSALLSLLGVIEDPPVEVDLQTVYNIGDTEIILIVKSEEPDPPPSSLDQEVSTCKLLVKINRSKPS